MLTALRTKSAGIVMKVILGLIILSFAVWGVEDAFRMQTSTTVAKVGDTEIGVDAFRDRFTRDLQRYSAQIGRPLSPSDATALGLDRQILGEMLAEATLQEQASRLKLSVSDAAIADSIVQDETFRGVNGQFDAQRFDQILRSNGLTEPRYVELQRRLLTRRQVVEGLVGGTSAPAVLSEAIFRHQSEQRSAAYVVLPQPDASAISAPEDAALQEFFEERKSSFQMPEQRTIAYLTLTAQTLAGAETVTDDEVRERFEAEKERLGAAERRTVDRITFPSLEEAQAASEKIRGGASFDDIAAERNVSASDLSLGTVTQGEIIDRAIAEAAFALPEGGVSDPVSGQFSNVIIRVSAITPAVVPAFDSVKETLRSDIATQRAQDKVLSLHDQIEDDRASGMTLTEIATKHNLELRTVTVDRQGRSNGTTADLPASTELLAEAFESDVGVENNAVQLPGNGYVWFDVTKIDPLRDRTFEEAKDDVLSRWREEEARKQLDAKVETALTELRDGKVQLSDIAVRENTQVQTVDNLDRRGGDLGTAVAAQVFSTSQGQFGSAPSSEEGRVLFQVLGVQTQPFDANREESRQLAQRISEVVENDLAAQYVTRLQTDLGTTINAQTIATAIGVQPAQ